MVDDSRMGIPPRAEGPTSDTPEDDPSPVVPEKKAERPEAESPPEDELIAEAPPDSGEQKGKPFKALYQAVIQERSATCQVYGQEYSNQEHPRADRRGRRTYKYHFKRVNLSKRAKKGQKG